MDVAENEAVNGTVMELGANVGSLGRSFSRLALAEDHSGTRYENPVSDLQILQENNPQNVQIQERQQNAQIMQNVHQNQLSARLNEQNMSQNLQIQHLQQNIQQNQQSFQQNVQIQQRHQNIQPNQTSMEQNVQIQQLQLNIQQNQQSVQQNIHQNMQILHLQQNQQNLQSQQSQQSVQQIARQNMQIHQNALQQSLQQQAVAKAALPASPQQHQPRSNGIVSHENGEPEADNDDASRDLQNGFNRDMHELEDLLSKLNPLAKEFVPPSLANHMSAVSLANVLMINNNNNRRKKNNYAQGKRRVNSRTSIAQREDSIRRTVYVSDVDQQVTEEQLAALFANCGQVVDCRVCGDPNSVLRFAFVEFTDEV